jgi:predicted DNA binding protein
VLIAELDVYHESFTLVPTIEAVPEATVRPELQPLAMVTVEPLTVYFTVTGGDPDRVDAALEADPTVIQPTVVRTVDDRRTYRARLRESDVSLPEEIARSGLRVLDAVSHAPGWRLRVEFPDRDALASFVRTARGEGFHVSLVRLFADEEGDGDDDNRQGLTDAELETLRLASRRGYFEVPRRITQRELAAELGISGSVLSRRLRRIVSKLVDASGLLDREADDDTI